MAGMPVGPLSLSDEVALDLGLKVIKATKVPKELQELRVHRVSRVDKAH
jgi:3-hydroxyacyl-CoA dehydrogenase